MSTEIWVAAIGALGGTGVLKLIEWWINRGRVREDTATQFRTELREELARVKADLIRQTGEVDKWKEKYFMLLEQFVVLKSNLHISMDEIQDAVLEHDGIKNGRGRLEGKEQRRR